MGPKSSLYQISSGYLKISRYFFLSLAILGLLGSVTGAFAQSGPQALRMSVQSFKVSPGICGGSSDTVSGTVVLSGSWNGVVHFGGTISLAGISTAAGNYGAPVNFTVSLSTSNFSPQSLNYPSLNKSVINYSDNPDVESWCLDYSSFRYAYSISAYDAQNNILATTSGGALSVSAPAGSANLFILTMEIPLFQVPALGISASNPDFANLFATFDQLPLGDFYMLLAEVALILLVGAGLINVILYLSGGSESQKGGTAGTLAGINNILVTLLLVFLLPFAYNAVAGFVNVLDQQIIAGPGNPYTQYLANSQLIWNTLPSGGNILTDFIGAIASVMAWAMSWLLGSARIFLIGSVTVAMPIVLVLRNIRFTARFAGVVEDTFFGLIFASVISALFIGLAAHILDHWQGSMFQAASVDQTWVALAALLGAILAPTVFAPMTGFFFQTMSQVGMAATGTAFAIGAGATGPAGAGIKGGMAMAGQAVAGISTPQPSFLQKAGAALSGFGGGFSHSLIPMGQNMLLMGTVGTLGGLGASRSASAINRAIELKMPAQTTQSIISYRAGALANELQLSSEMKPFFERAFAAGVHHDKLRDLDVKHHNDFGLFQSAIGDEIRKIKGIS